MLHFDQLIKLHFSLLKPLFVKTGRQHLTSGGVLKMFVINWSPPGSNRRVAEEKVVLNFTHYLSELEGNKVQSHIFCCVCVCVCVCVHVCV